MNFSLTKTKKRISFAIIASSFALFACVPNSIENAPTQISQTTNIPSPTIPEPTPTIIPTPAPTSLPPAHFENELLRDGIQLQAYIDDECQFLAQRWDPENALPGTVVAPIMFHSIRPGNEEPGDPSAINADLFAQIIELARYYGFETITSQELIEFLQTNQRIPQLSMMLIVDDRRPGTAEDYFLPIMRENDWTTSLGWLVGDTDIRTGLWGWIERLNETGYFDILSHGFNHIYLQENMTDEMVWEEIWGSIPVFEQHFGTRPLAFIWPGGNYTAKAINFAREAEFEIGFTIHSRGPILFNAIPQGEQEIAFGDPLMTLPRFWSSAALLNLDQSVSASKEALSFAIENYSAEADWFSQNCGAELSPLEIILGDEEIVD